MSTTRKILIPVVAAMAAIMLAGLVAGCGSRGNPLAGTKWEAQDIKEGRVSKVVVTGEDLTITRIDGLVLRSHKEHTADLIQLLTNLGVTPEMMSNIIIEVETPETPPA